MQQDIIMEKKPLIRSNQTPAKGQSVESKKNQDLPSNKVWARNARPTYSANPKPPPQRNRNVGYDKRPRSRAVGGKTDARLEDVVTESGSVIKYGSKKQSLNHLLNFHYTPRSSTGPGGYGRQYYQKGKMHYPKYNKEHYLQANCQFIVREGEDYSICLTNPDALVDWTYIEQIMVKSEDPPNCPICLEKPLAGRITRCGHIYCFPCVLHYLALSDKAWRKCPICYEAVHVQDLKSVCWVPIGSFGIGDTITLQLMRRPRNSMQSWPVDLDYKPIFAKNSSELPNMNDGPHAMQYCKLLQANSQQVLNIINMDIEELNVAWKLEENTPEACFIQQALELLKGYQNEKLKNIPSTKNHEISDLTPVENLFESLSVRDSESFETFETDDQCVFETESGQSVFEQEVLPDVDCVISSSLDEAHGSGSATSTGDVVDKDFYFYQASDGQHIYLAGLCARVLEHSYGGSLASCPRTITATVEAREVLTVTEDLRKRLRYLQHLPVTCQIELVELNLHPPTVSAESLHLYHEQLEARRKSRLRKCREQDRRDMQITREQERKHGLPISSPSEPQREVRIDSESDFPLCGSPPSTSSNAGNNLPVSNLDLNSKTEAINIPGPSFATMLTMAKSPSFTESRPTRNVDYVWPSPSTSQESKTNEYSENSDENFIPAPSYTQSFRDAISQAMEKSCQSNVSSKDGGTKKNKKKKRQVLFATGMNFQV